MSPVPLLEVKGLHKTFRSGSIFGRARKVIAVSDASFRVERGEALAVVGESGSGKSTIARLLLRLERADRGEIRLDGVDVLRTERRRASLSYRGRVQMVFQDPFGSLNPVHDVAHHLMRPLVRHGRSGARGPVKEIGEQLEGPLGGRLANRASSARWSSGSGDAVRGEVKSAASGARRASPATPGLERHRHVPRSELRDRALELLRIVGLEPAEEMIERLPFELSGGQRQRVAIARALAVQPDLLVADEPTSMLDVSIRTGVLNLLLDLKRAQGLGIVLITHDLASARYLADRILVLYRGRIVEEGDSRELIESPAHPYTRALLAAIADASAATSAPSSARPGSGEEPAAQGCPFAPRCPEVMDRCRAAVPGPVSIGGGRRVRCYLYGEGGAGSEGAS